MRGVDAVLRIEAMAVFTLPTDFRDTHLGRIGRN
jgi:hypothetical protein